MSVILWKAEAVSLKAGRNPKLVPSAFSVRVWFANWKIQSQPESRRLFYLVGMFTAPSLGDRFSVALRNCSKEARGAVRLHTSLQQREQAVWASSAGVKLGNLALFVWEEAGLWAHCIGSLCASAGWGQSCFLVHLASCIPPAPQQSPYRRQHLLDLSLGSPHHIGRPKIADGCDMSCLLIWQEVFSFHKVKKHLPS